MRRSVILAIILLPCLAFGQDSPKTTYSENIASTTPCEGLTGALPEAITECQKRETARLFIVLGKPEAALRVLCSTKVAKDAFGTASLDCVKETKTKEK